ncbi:MAG: galactose mutarotase [Candidatus Cloacimonetes bacterium]|nr:galactose mutarotase [Candidatus Cloacimonadota bacterium]
MRAKLYTLMNRNQMKVSITNYGGIITSIIVPDKNGKMSDVVLGYDNVEDYIENSPYFGAIIGRYGNRIARGKFSIGDEIYQLATNNEPNHLHGGQKGFDKVIWDAKIIDEKEHASIKLSYYSKDGEEGYPGNLKVDVVYALTDNNELVIKYFAKTDKITICNLTNHTYFNLKDAGKSEILGQQLLINADYFTPIDSTLIPIGEMKLVENTPFDFRSLKNIGDDIDEESEQIKNGIGYDHNFVLNESEKELKLAARLIDQSSGRSLEIKTTEPGLQFYSGNFLDGTIEGKYGIFYNHRTGLCLEPQHFPDSPNQPSFPTTLLTPDDNYESRTVYRFSIIGDDLSANNIN